MEPDQCGQVALVEEPLYRRGGLEYLVDKVSNRLVPGQKGDLDYHRVCWAGAEDLDYPYARAEVLLSCGRADRDCLGFLDVRDGYLRTVSFCLARHVHLVEAVAEIGLHTPAYLVCSIPADR